MMETIKEWFQSVELPQSTWLVAGSVGVAGLMTYLVHRRIVNRSRKTFPPDVVVVHKYCSCQTSPCASPFSLKLETFLRLAKIPYETEEGIKTSPKGKKPWILHKGIVISDSQFCIDYLKKEFNVDLNKGMTQGEMAVARAMRLMVEENLYWYLICERWVYRSNSKWMPELGVPWLVSIVQGFILGRQSWAQGMGRHTKDEVFEIGTKDVVALSAQLGDKSFMFGDHPIEEDCAIFGQLSTIYYSLHGSAVSNYMRDNLPNLIAYCERMKALAWPDWEQCLVKPKNTQK